MPHEEAASIVLDSSPTRGNVTKCSFRELGRPGDDDMDNATATTTMSWCAYIGHTSGSCDVTIDDASSSSSFTGDHTSKSPSWRNDRDASERSIHSQMTSIVVGSTESGASAIGGGFHLPPTANPAVASSFVHNDDDQLITRDHIREKAQCPKNNDEVDEPFSTSNAKTERIAQTRMNSCVQSVCVPGWTEDIQQKSRNGSILPTSGKLAYVEDCVRGKRLETGEKFTLPDHSVASNSAIPEALMDLESSAANDMCGFHRRPGAYIVRTAFNPSCVPHLTSSAESEPSTYLVEASLVEDEPNVRGENGIVTGNGIDDVFEAKPIKETSLWKSRGIQCAVFWIVILTSGAAVGITIGLMMRKPQSTLRNQDAEANHSSWEPTTSPTESPRTTDFIKELQSILPFYTMIALKNEASPQAKAFQWIRQNPPTENNSLKRTAQRFALATLFFATDGTNWDGNEGWLNAPSHECDWIMSFSTESDRSCDITGESIVALPLVQNSLDGTIPSEIVLLESLRTLHLESNPELDGTIPEAIASSSITEIQLNDNRLTGFLPDLNPNVTAFLVSENNLAGKLPDSYANLTRLARFSVRSNSISGMFADDIYSHWPMATSIDVSDNQFTGSISEMIGLLGSLTALSLKANNFTGPVPSELGKLTGLHELHLGENRFSGSIPAEIAAARRLQVLDLEANLHTGMIPSELQLLTDLQELRLGSNALVGTLPKGIMSLEHVQVLSFGQNSLNGTIPTGSSLQSSAQILSLHHNQFTGTIPNISNFSSIVELRLNSNNLTGTIPNHLGLLRSLEVLSLENNLLTGTIPSALGLLESIIEMTLSGNRLNGTVPVELCALIKANNANVEVDCDRVECDCGCTCCGPDHRHAT